MSRGCLLSRVEQTKTLEAAVAKLAAAGGKRLEGLERLGIFTLRDLLCNYPFRYNDLSKIVPIAEASLAKPSSILGTVKNVKLKRPKPSLSVVEVSVVDDSGTLIASWFNQPWILKILTPGTRVILMGRVEHSYGFRRMKASLHSVIDEDVKAGSILPVYRSNSLISQGWILHCIDDALALLPAPFDPLPASLRVTHGFISRHAAWRGIHHPKNQKNLKEARRRLAFEEVFLLQVYLQLKKRQLQAHAKAYEHKVDGAALSKLSATLPFTLTADQQNSLNEILADMKSDQVMNRLLLGDVGSGKTIVAALALTAVFDSDLQAAMMAPTEVLAIQYAQKLGPLFDDLGIPWALLTSSTKAAQRNECLEKLKAGAISVLFGTHALIEPDVCFKALSLVIIDEQHRFGVEQRDALCAKGQACDLLSMTATPIPRSLALTIYGDMDTSYIRTKPYELVSTTTKVIHRSDIRLAYEAIHRALERGEQAYIVCPLIGGFNAHRQKPPLNTESRGEAQGETCEKLASAAVGAITNAAENDRNADDELEDEILITEFTPELDETHIRAAEQELRFLQAKIFPEKNLGLMTSRLKSAEKSRVMDEFRRGEIDLLISTTVIEVGVDVPNATVMIIENADRFGLSQLHQLRGRVGRGAESGEVFLVTATERENSLKRLVALQKSSDGFALAEYDLSLRREGDVLGSRQHGAARLRLVNVIQDAELIQSAHEAAKSLLQNDPGLTRPENALLCAEIETLFKEKTCGAEAFGVETFGAEAKHL